MDFAKKQLEKFGWKDGEGLGKESQGITAAIKPHLKTGKEGMGFDLSQELTDTWWTKAYSDSLSRIKVDSQGEEVDVKLIDDSDGSQGKKKRKGSKRSITDNTDNEPELRPMEKMRRKMMKANFTTFSKGGTLLRDGVISKPEKNSNADSSDSDTDLVSLPSRSKTRVLNDEELFKVCGGRTLHKAARFGHKLSGKLARIAAQEQTVIVADSTPQVPQQKSEANIEVETSSKIDEDLRSTIKNKKKRKRRAENSEIEANS